MATTRFKGESGSDRLGVSTISDSDMIQVRHKPGTVDDADKGVSKAVLNSCPFGVSSTAAATAAKTAALTDSNPDFTLISGREVVVCFSAANSASSPTLNFAGSGAYPMYYPDGTAIGNWDAGTWMHLKYFEATINETLTQRWIALSPVVTNAITSGDKRPAASGAVATLGKSMQLYNGTTYDGTIKPLSQSIRNFRYLYIGLITNGDYDYMFIPTELISNGSIFVRTMMRASSTGLISLPFDYQSTVTVTIDSDTSFHAVSMYNNVNWILKVFAIWGIV